MQDNWKFEPGLAFNDLDISQQAGRRSLQRRWIIPSLLMHCIAYSIAGDTVIPVCTDWISHFDQRRFHTLMIATLALQLQFKCRTIESLKQDSDLIVSQQGGCAQRRWIIPCSRLCITNSIFIRMQLIQCSDTSGTNMIEYQLMMKGGFTLAIAWSTFFLPSHPITEQCSADWPSEISIPNPSSPL